LSRPHDFSPAARSAATADRAPAARPPRRASHARLAAPVRTGTPWAQGWLHWPTRQGRAVAGPRPVRRPAA